MVEITIHVDSHQLEKAFQTKSSEMNAKLDQFQTSILNSVKNWVKREAPHKTGHLEASVTVQKNGHGGMMFLDKGIANYGEAVIDGHPTINSDRQRRFWFAMLQDKYGGSYNRKTSGGPGHVGGQPFIDKAMPKIESDIARKCKQFETWLGDL